jgi:L-ectoine synthase
VLVRTLADVREAGRELTVAHGNIATTRILTKRDGVGFSFSVVRASAGTESTLWYKNHWEANYILSGLGELEELAMGRRWTLEAGFFYVVGPEDRHVVRVFEDLEIVSVFNPPIEGMETHDADGSYPPTGPIPPGPPSS